MTFAALPPDPLVAFLTNLLRGTLIILILPNGLAVIGEVCGGFGSFIKLRYFYYTAYVNINFAIAICLR